MKVLEAKIRKVSRIRTDAPEMQEALGTVATFAEDQASLSDVRRNLRAELERRSLALAEEFLASCRPLEEALTGLDTQLGAIEHGCDAALARLRHTQTRTSAYLQSAEKIAKQREKALEDADKAQQLLASVTLPPEAEAALQEGPGGRTQDGWDFFRAVGALQDLRQRAEAMVGTDLHSTGIELLDRTARMLDETYSRCFSWVQHHAVEAVSPESPESDSNLQRALAILRSRPALFQTALETVTGARKKRLARAFVRALRQGDLASGARPIDVHAHNTARYAADVLAWVHEAVLAEKAAWRALDLAAAGSGGGGAGETKGEEGEGEEGEEEEEAWFDSEVLVEATVAGLVRPVEVRLGQSISAERDIPVVFRLWDICAFYHRTFQALLPSGSPLRRMLLRLRRDAARRCVARLEEVASQQLGAGVTYPSDLGPLHAVTDTLTRMRSILRIHEQCLAAAAPAVDPEETTADAEGLEEEEEEEEGEEGASRALIDPERAAESLLSTALGPLEQVVRRHAAQLGPTDAAVFVLNNLQALQTALAPFAAAAQWVQRLAEGMQPWEETLVTHEGNRLLSQAGALSALRSLESRSEADEPAATVAGLEPVVVRAAVESLVQQLRSLDLPALRRVQAPRLRSRLRRDVGRVLATAFSALADAVEDPQNGYADSEGEGGDRVLVHSRQEVQMLLEGI